MNHSPAVTVDINSEILERFRSVGVCFAFDREVAKAGGGWLAELPQYTFRSEIAIEGPCGFYGGVFGPNPWTVEGGLCAMGAASYSHSPLPETMLVGRYCSIGKNLRFLDFSHPVDWLSSSVAFFRPMNVKTLSALSMCCDEVAVTRAQDFKPGVFDPKRGLQYPSLGEDVWIGENVTLGLGIHIGTGAIVAAGSIVTKDVPPYAIVAGAPAQVRKYRFDDALIQELLQSRWWDYCFADFAGLNFEAPDIFLKQFAQKIASGEINRWLPAKLCLPQDVL